MVWGSGNTLQCFWLYLEGGLLIGEEIGEGYSERRKDYLLKFAVTSVADMFGDGKSVSVAEVKNE